MGAEQPGAHDEVTIALDAAQPSGAGVGVVVEVGEHSAALHGKRVLVGAFDPCGACEVCRAGSPAACSRGKPRAAPARRVRAASRWLVELGDGLELPMPAAAAVAGDVVLAYTLYARASLAPREPVIVVGGNAVARFAIDILVSKSIAPVAVIDERETAWCAELAARGIAVARPAHARQDVAAAVAAQGVGSRPPRVLVTERAAVELACELAGPRATVVVLAERTGPALPTGAFGELFAREVCVVGVSGPHPDLILEAAALCARGDIDLVAGVSEDASDRTRSTIVRAARLPR